jgi:hypothetical protein
MKRLDDDKVSLVEFLSSIKFATHRDDANQGNDSLGHFAPFKQKVRKPGQVNREDLQLIRSAN